MVPPGQTRSVTFEFRNLKPGLHQVSSAASPQPTSSRLATPLPAFKVGEARRLLTITDDKEAAAFWQAHMVKDEFSCLAVLPDEVEIGDGGATIVRYAPDASKPDAKITDDIRGFEVVCLLGVKNPHAVNPARPADGTLWDRLRPHLRTGGKLIIMPPPDTNIDIAGYNSATDIVPGALKRVIETKKLDPPPPEQKASSWPAPREGKNGVAWVSMKAASTDVEARRRVAARDEPRLHRRPADDEGSGSRSRKGRDTRRLLPRLRQIAKRHPRFWNAPYLTRRTLTSRRAKYCYSVRMDVMPEDDNMWHNYWNYESTFFAAFPNLLVRYLAGDTADANFNFVTGATVSVPLPRGRLNREAR